MTGNVCAFLGDHRRGHEISGMRISAALAYRVTHIRRTKRIHKNSLTRPLLAARIASLATRLSKDFLCPSPVLSGSATLYVDRDLSPGPDVELLINCSKRIDYPHERQESEPV